MRKIYFIFVAIFISSMGFAQDIIVKKDGKTILAKVIEVGSTDIKYTLHNSSDKSTHTINVSELLSINYENGEKETFDKTIKPNNSKQTTSLSSVIMTQSNNSNSEYKIDLNTQLDAENLYRKSNRAKTGAIISGVVGGVCCLISTVSLIINSKSEADDVVQPAHIVCYGVGIGGLAGALILNKKSKKIKQQAREILPVSVIQTEYQTGDFALCPSIDILSDTYYPRKKSVGLGVKLKF